MTRPAAALLVAVLCAACGGGLPAPSPSPTPLTGLAGQVTDAASDTELLKPVQAAVNDVLANADDCEKAKPFLAGAQAKLDEAAGRVRTQTGRMTIDTLRTQVKNVATTCP